MAPVVQAPLFSFISDQSLALILPIVVYWAYSLFFHWISLKEFPWIEKYRIHDKEEETRNKVSLPEVIKAVIVQQVLQTALGFIVVVADDSEMVFDDALGLTRYQFWISSALSLLGMQSLVSQSTIASAAHVCYFYLESLVRFFVAMSILDTWQYFLHRLFHNVPYLYKHFHSRHHRLYVTYSFGALYNHPFEGFLMDSVGASLAFLISGMGNRGALAFFSFSTLKTVDDHCGYNLPFNPLQTLFWNNADYHDIHHQNFGIKSNFSQPFGTIWDHVLGTHMSREEANKIIKMKEERKAARQAKQQQQQQPLVESNNMNNNNNNKVEAFSTKVETPVVLKNSPTTTIDDNSNVINNNSIKEGEHDEDVHSSGNNSGHDSHGEEEDGEEGITHHQHLLGVRPRLEQRRASFQNKNQIVIPAHHHLEDHAQLGLGEPSAVQFAPGLRGRLSARAQQDRNESSALRRVPVQHVQHRSSTIARLKAMFTPRAHHTHAGHHGRIPFVRRARGTAQAAGIPVGGATAAGVGPGPRRYHRSPLASLKALFRPHRTRTQYV
ncbi:hypothetical protein BG004_004691 [Podila humilis]|nr:hypothetical protein BG004_004691 [Podila humilis]